MPEPAVVVRGVTKVFPPRTRTLPEVLRRVPRRGATTALAGVDLEVARGELFGLLGPNGAGKTTLVKILSTLLLPTAGEARVAGFSCATQEHEVRSRVGVVLGGDRGLYWRLSARENLWYFSQLYGMPDGRARERIAAVLRSVGLEGRADDRVEDYSKGMKQRLHVARGLLTDPEVLLLDEPTIGLDAHAARELRALVRALVAEERRTVVLTTHYLHEADALSDRVGILHRGRLVALGPPAELKARHGAPGLLVRARGAPDDLPARLGKLPGARRVDALPFAEGVGGWRVSGAVDATEAAAEVARGGGKLVELKADEPTLEDVFVGLTGERLTEAGGAAAAGARP